jgi:hypothetical protein
MPNITKPSKGYHQGEQHSRIPLVRSRARLNFAAVSGIVTYKELQPSHQAGQRPEESRRLFILSILTQALAVIADVTGDVGEELDS